MARLRLHAHEAAEFLFVSCGDLLVQADGLDYELAAGDSIYMYPSIPTVI